MSNQCQARKSRDFFQTLEPGFAGFSKHWKPVSRTFPGIGTRFSSRFPFAPRTFPFRLTVFRLVVWWLGSRVGRAVPGEPRAVIPFPPRLRVSFPSRAPPASLFALWPLWPKPSTPLRTLREFFQTSEPSLSTVSKRDARPVEIGAGFAPPEVRVEAGGLAPGVHADSRSHEPNRSAIFRIREICGTWNGQRFSQWPQAVQSEAWRASLA